LKLALAMAASQGGLPLLGVEGSGTGLMYTFEPGRSLPEKQPGDVNASWGPRRLYPPSTFAEGVLPATRLATVPINEAAEWPRQFRSFAPRVRVPVRITLGEHERLWVVSEEHFAALRAVLVSSPRVETDVQPGAGHNVSLSRAGRAYHMKALAFAEECIREPPQEGSG
jgi:hypothetical protein